MTTDVQTAQSLYDKLKPLALAQPREYIRVRTPPHLQDEMAAIISADMPPTLPPVVVDAPYVSQTGTGVGSTMNCTLGNWENTPSTRTYQWKRGITNVGTNAASYTVTAPDIGTTFTCVMTATNGVGTSAPVTSNSVVVA
jgi:hypothetical protein